MVSAFSVDHVVVGKTGFLPSWLSLGGWLSFRDSVARAVYLGFFDCVYIPPWETKRHAQPEEEYYGHPIRLGVAQTLWSGRSFESACVYTL